MNLLSPDKRFIYTPLFLITIITLSLLFIFITIPLCVTFYQKFDCVYPYIGPKEVANVFEYFNAPLKIIGVAITLTGLYLAIYRTNQTKQNIENGNRQIEISEMNTKLTYKINHFENFEKKIENMNKEFEILSIKNIEELHEILYDYQYGNGYVLKQLHKSTFAQAETKIAEQIKIFNEETRKLLLKKIEKNTDEFRLSIKRIEEFVNDFCTMYKLERTQLVSTHKKILFLYDLEKLFTQLFWPGISRERVIDKRDQNKSNE